MNSIAFVNTTPPVTVLASELAGVANEIDFERPGLKLFRRHGLVEGLLDGDEIEQPEGAAGLGDMLGAVGEENVAVDPVAIPMLGTGETVHDLGCKLRGVMHIGLLRFLLFCDDGGGTVPPRWRPENRGRIRRVGQGEFCRARNARQGRGKFPLTRERRPHPGLRGGAVRPVCFLF